MKLIKTEEAVGHVLCHDLTQIIKDVTKDARFRKGHIVAEEDIPVLLSMGKDYLYIWENDETMYHENDAAQILCDVCINEHMTPTPVKEGKIELKAGIAPLCSLYPYQIKKAGIITTGNEVYYGRIQDKFTPVVVEKLKSYHIEVMECITVNDDQEKIKNAILDFKEKGCFQ